MLNCSWEGSGFGMEGRVSRERERERESLKIVVATNARVGAAPGLNMAIGIVVVAVAEGRDDYENEAGETYIYEHIAMPIDTGMAIGIRLAIGIGVGGMEPGIGALDLGPLDYFVDYVSVRNYA